MKLDSYQPNKIIVNNLETLNVEEPIAKCGNITFNMIVDAIVNKKYSLSISTNHFFQSNVSTEVKEILLTKNKILHDVNNCILRARKMCEGLTMEEIKSSIISAFYFAKRHNINELPEDKNITLEFGNSEISKHI